MKIVLLIIFLFTYVVGVFSQNSNDNIPEAFYNIAFTWSGETLGQYQDVDAVKLLYKEINAYREKNGVAKCEESERIVNYACRWGAYMMSKHINNNNIFYEHSKEGPVEYHIPSSCSEIIHLIYFGYKPSNVEIVSGLMYGVERPTGNVKGWIQSKGHNDAILQPEVKYYGASIYVIQQGQWWVVYGTVNFSLVK